MAASPAGRRAGALPGCRTAGVSLRARVALAALAATLPGCTGALLPSAGLSGCPAVLLGLPGRPTAAAALAAFCPRALTPSACEEARALLRGSPGHPGAEAACGALEAAWLERYRRPEGLPAALLMVSRARPLRAGRVSRLQAADLDAAVARKGYNSQPDEPMPDYSPEALEAEKAAAIKRLRKQREEALLYPFPAEDAGGNTTTIQPIYEDAEQGQPLHTTTTTPMVTESSSTNGADSGEAEAESGAGSEGEAEPGAGGGSEEEVPSGAEGASEVS